MFGAASPKAGNSPTYLTVDASRMFLYVVNGLCEPLLVPPVTSGGNDISGYAIDHTSGALTPLVGSPFPAPGGPGAATVRGQLVYMFGNGAGTISIFAIDEATGALTAIIGSPFILPGIGSTNIGPAIRVSFANGSNRRASR